jgi:hypothetical protein
MYFFMLEPGITYQAEMYKVIRVNFSLPVSCCQIFLKERVE